MSHAKLSPSGAHRWMACPGSIRLCDGIESKDSVYSREGTFAHEIAANCLRDGVAASAFLGTSDGEFTFDAEMAGYVQQYLDAVRITMLCDGGELLVETSVKISEDIYGTADAIVLTHDTIHVFDLKMGRGVFVVAEGNEQLLTYGLGALLHVQRPGLRWVKLHIVQPRCSADETWRQAQVEAGWLATEFQKELLLAAEETKKPDAPLNPGEHCQFCAAKPGCPALRERAMEVGRAAFGTGELVVTPPAVQNMTPEQIAWTLQKAPLLEEWLKAVHEQATSTLRSGGSIPGFKLVEKRGNRKWKNENEAEVALRGCGIDPMAAPEILSPAQAEKLLAKVAGKSRALAVMEQLAHKPVSGATLAPQSDPRPALLAGSAFTPIGDE